MGAQDVASANRARNPDFWDNRIDAASRSGARPDKRPDLWDNEALPGRGDRDTSPAPRGHNSIRHVAPADAPRAAQSRAVRRAWASRVNQVLRRTGNLEEARRAGAELVMAALDCDAITARAHFTGWWGRRGSGLDTATITLSPAARRRSANDDGAGDRIIEAIMNDEIPSGDPAP